VSDDDSVVATISTSGAMTASGKHGVGKLLKIRSDMFFLMLANAPRRIVVLTERDMYELCLREKQSGRVPSSIEFVLATLPDELSVKLKESRSFASIEVSPTRHGP
jgi:hypothetical protein